MCLANQAAILGKRIFPSLCSLQARCQAAQIFLSRRLHQSHHPFSTLSMFYSLPMLFSNLSCPFLLCILHSLAYCEFCIDRLYFKYKPKYSVSEDSDFLPILQITWPALSAWFRCPKKTLAGGIVIQRAIKPINPDVLDAYLPSILLPSPGQHCKTHYPEILLDRENNVFWWPKYLSDKLSQFWVAAEVLANFCQSFVWNVALVMILWLNQ